MQIWLLLFFYCVFYLLKVVITVSALEERQVSTLNYGEMYFSAMIRFSINCLSVYICVPIPL